MKLQTIPTDLTKLNNTIQNDVLKKTDNENFLLKASYTKTILTIIAAMLSGMKTIKNADTFDKGIASIVKEGSFTSKN